jgi:PAS domain S-box-containing protein
VTLRARRRLFRRTAAVVLGLVGLAVAVPAVLRIRAQGAVLRAKLHDRALATGRIAALSASDLLITNDLDELGRRAAELVHRDPDIASALITDRNGTVVGHSRVELEGTVVPDLVPPPTAAEVVELRLADGSPVLRATTPIEVSGEPWGAIRFDVLLKSIAAESRAEMLRVGLLALLFTALGGVGAAWLARSVAEPVEQLVTVAAAVAAGNLATRSGIRRDDEIGTLATSFDRMVEQLAHARAALEAHAAALENTVAERTRELRDSEGRTRAILEAAPDGILTIDEHGTLESVNAAAEAIFALPPATTAGQNLTTIIPALGAHPAATPAALIAGVWATAGRGAHEGVGRRADGDTFPVELATSALETKAGRRLTLIVRDITERKAVEETLRQMNAELKETRDRALEATRLKSEFLANMSHELRTPMNGIFGMTEILLDTELSLDQREYAETVRRCADSLLTVINDVLDFSKIEAGKLELETIDFDLQTVVDDAVVVVAPRAAAKNLELACRIEPDVPGILRGDPNRLRQVLLNLLGNAVKFTEQGEVVLHASVVKHTEAQATLRFAVSDTGIGIPADRMHRLFQSFTQVDGSMTRRYGGTGLGLAIAQQLAELMAGKIGVTSEVGRGSTFWFTAVFGRGDDTTVRHPPLELHGVRILIVDDNETNRDILRWQVHGWGMRGDTASDAAEALELLRVGCFGGDPYQVALLDMQMPGMDGEALARTIRADGSLAGLALVLLTSLGEMGGSGGMPTPFAARLTKPVRGRQLEDCLLRVLREVPAQRAPDAAATPATPGPGDASGPRILLAEDDQVNQFVATRMLERMGLHVDVVANGREAVGAALRQAYDLILMDVQMPEMDGLEATLEIRRSEGRKRRTPIVAMTAYAMRGDRERCLAAGMDDYLAKPVQTAGLHAILARWVQRALPARPGAAPTPT